MQLSRLEMYGFKSFGEKTDISFAPGITAFVGPNGCGKSNVVDAIRWVLGEQNPRNLRAGKMEDIFFAGNERLRSKNYAEVGIVLDNQDRRIDLDYTEITVTRRLYRSGESEYFINRVPCRLKDITELLTTAFLGKGTYSIIGQGQIEEVISSRPEDRRLMFEEAAGVSLYKIRKRDALKKLEDTRANLHRIGDIIHELAGQQEELAASASKARKYTALSERADRLELAQWANRHRELGRRLTELNDTREDIKGKLASNQANQTELAGETEAVRQAIKILEEQEAGLTQEIASLTQESTATTYEIQLSAQRKGDLEKLAEAYKEQLVALRSEEVYLQERIDLLTGQAAGDQAQIELCRIALARREQLGGLATRLAYYPNRAMKKADEQIIEAMVASTNVANQLEGAGKLKEELTQQLLALDAEVSDADSRQTLLEARLAEVSGQAQAVSLTIQEMEEALAEQRENYLALEQQRMDKARRASQLENQLMAARSQLTLARQQDEDNLGYSHSVRRVLKAAKSGSIQGVLGTMAQLVKVKDAAHNLALETALGGALQYLVCTSEDACQRGIEYLKREQAGRATFVPLNIEHKGHSRGPLPTGALAWAPELVSAEPQLEPVIAMLLGNVLVTQDLTTARAVARDTGYRYKIVTCQGEVISRGLFTGGAERSQGPGLLQRRQTIAALQQQVQALSQEVQSEAAALTLVDESLAETKSAILSLEESLPAIREESLRLRQLVLEARENLDSHQRGISLCRQRADQFKHRLTQATQQIAELEAQVEQGILRLDTCNSLREKYKRAEGKSRDYAEQQNSRLKGIQLIWLSLKGQTDARHRELEQNQQRLLSMKQRLWELEGQVQTARKQATELGDKLLLLQESLSVTDSRQQEGRQQQLVLKHQREGRLVELEALASDLQSFEDEAKRLEGSLHDLSVKEARWETEQEVMVSELAERHGLLPEAAMNCYEPDLSVGEINIQLKNLRQEIQSLGEVNLAAIGQHQRLLERLEFLSQQQMDLLQAEKDINRLIGELDTTIKKLFLDTFNQVQEHFGRIFRELFEGGTAYLSLSNQEDIFETGIEIFAQPPGKRIQSLSLLSGGEKAMTAIALMFSLLSVQPAPFCILDEIEAALDDSNILRFARYLKNLALDMQFLIITHRRETMEYADNLYGVTLDGNSSSKLVSVTLNQQAG